MKATIPSEIAGVVGSTVDAEAMICLKDMLNKLGVETVCTESTFPLDDSGWEVWSYFLKVELDCQIVHIEDFKIYSCRIDFRSNYIMNSKIAGIEQSDLILLVGTNPRLEAPLVNARIRKT